MAVYTEIRRRRARRASSPATTSAPSLSLKGIAEGVENSNYLLVTETGQFILTLYEKRVDPADLPFFLGLMEHLAARGHHLPAAGPRPRRRGARHGSPGGRRRSSPSSPGMWVRRPRVEHCAAVGAALARAAPGRRRVSRSPRRNALSVAGWRPLFERCDGRADSGAARARRGDRATSSTSSKRTGRRTCRRASSTPISFPTMSSSCANQLSGLIDFYFACNDMLAYDVAICLNAWCFEPDGVAQRHQGAGAARRLSRRCARFDRAEIAALPLLARGSALRFLLTRLYDWLTVPAGALVVPKDPLEYYRSSASTAASRDAGAYGLDPDDRAKPRHDLDRRRLLRQSRPRRLGRGARRGTGTRRN